MRILFITDTLPYPAITGAPLRSYNILRRLAHKHRVWLAAFAKTSEQREGMTHMQTFCEEVVTDSLPADNALSRTIPKRIAIPHERCTPRFKVLLF
jgi:hypothetical protein